MTAPKVTVLLAVHNGAAHLGGAIESILGQSLTDFELLIVDDASSDGSAELAEAYGDPRIRIVRNPRNLGQIPSLNRGLREARGAYVARLDHDDLSLPERLERQARVLDTAHEVVLVATWADIVTDDGAVWTQIRTRIESFADFAAGTIVDRLPLVHPSLMFRRDVVAGLGGFDETLGAAEDKDLYRRLVLDRHEARVVPDVLVVYRRHEGQMTYASAGMVRENDERSQESFIAALAPGLPPRPLRLLLGSSPRYWDGEHIGSRDVEAFLAAASARLRLDGDERRQLAEALAAGIARSALVGWSEAPAGYGADVRRLLPFVRAHGTAASRALVALVPLAVASRPLGRMVPAGRRALWSGLRSSQLEGVRRRAARSRALRAVYSTVIGTRLLRR